MTRPSGILAEADTVGAHGQSSLDRARENLARAEEGGHAAVQITTDIERSDPAPAKVAEQEASDGPEGRGLSR